MSYTQTTTFADATAMSASLLQAELDNLRTAINGNVDDADITADSVTRLSLAQPRIQAFPGNVTAELMHSAYAAVDYVQDVYDWRYRRDRFDVFPQASLDDNGQQVVMGRTVWARNGSMLEFAVQASINVAYTITALMGVYPSMHCGDVAVYVRRRSFGGARQKATGSGRQLWADVTAYGPPLAVFEQRGQVWITGGWAVTADGWYDVLFVYDGSSAASTLSLVEFGHRGMMVAVMPRQAQQ